MPSVGARRAVSSFTQSFKLTNLVKLIQIYMPTYLYSASQIESREKTYSLSRNAFIYNQHIANFGTLGTRTPSTDQGEM